MMKAVNTIQIQKGKVDEIIPRFQTLQGVQDAPGFIRLEVWKNTGDTDNDEIQVCTTWESAADFTAWTESDAFKAKHKKRHENRSPDSPILGAKLSTFEVEIVHEK